MLEPNLHLLVYHVILLCLASPQVAQAIHRQKNNKTKTYFQTPTVRKIDLIIKFLLFSRCNEVFGDIYKASFPNNLFQHPHPTN